MPVKRPFLILTILAILVCICGCSVVPNTNLPVGKTAHLGTSDSGIAVTVLSVRQFEPDALKCSLEFENNGENTAAVDPELVIKFDNRERSAGFPVFTVRKDQKEFRTFDVDMNPEDIATIRSKGALVIFTFKGQEASWTVAPADLAGTSGAGNLPATPDQASGKNDLSLQLLNQADFSSPLTYYQIDTSQRPGDTFQNYGYKETYLAAGQNISVPFSFQENIVRFPPGNASHVVESYNAGLIASMKRYSAGGFSVTLEKLPDLNIGDKGYAYRMKTPVSTDTIAFFSKGDIFVIVSVVHPAEGRDAFLREVAQKAEKKIVG